MPIMIFMTRYYHSYNFHFRFSSVIFNLLHIPNLIPLAFALLFITSCEEGPTKIGAGLLPSSDFISVKPIDTLSIRSYTLYDNSIKTDNSAVGFIGHVYDPYFGSATSDFVTQLRLGEEWYFGDYTVDSVKMFLTFLNVLGSTDQIATLRLREIGELLSADSAYYSNKPVILADPGYDLAIALPVLKSDTVNNFVLDLPIEFGQYLIRDTAMLFHSDSKDDFRSFFKGVHFSLETGTDPILASLYLESPTSGSATHNTNHNYIAVYLSEDGYFTEYDLFIDAYNRNASYIRYSHDFSTAEEDKKIQHINDPVNGLNDTLSYLQYLSGAYTKLVFPGLEDLKRYHQVNNIAINKARLSLPVYFDGDVYTPSTVPSALLLLYRDNEGLRYPVPDYSFDTYHTFFDGSLDSTANEYSFNIPAFIQRYLDDLTGEIKPELEIFQGTSSANNVILKANGSKTPVKLEVTYTEF